jgi:hypothetical protein
MISATYLRLYELHIAPQHEHDRPHCKTESADIHMDQCTRSNNRS